MEKSLSVQLLEKIFNTEYVWVDELKELIEKGANINEEIDFSNEELETELVEDFGGSITPFIAAVYNTDCPCDAFRYLLSLQDSKNLNKAVSFYMSKRSWREESEEYSNFTALHMAVAQFNISMLELLLEREDIDTETQCGRFEQRVSSGRYEQLTELPGGTLIQLALQLDHNKEIIDLLLNSGKVMILDEDVLSAEGFWIDIPRDQYLASKQAGVNAKVRQFKLSKQRLAVYKIQRFYDIVIK